MAVEKRRKFIINVLYWIILIGLIYMGFKYILPLLMPFCIAALFTAIMLPFIKFLTNKLKFKRNISSVIALFLFFALAGGILLFTGVKLVNWIINVANTVPAFYTSTIEPALSGLMDNIENLANDFDPALKSMVENVTPEITSSISSAVTNFSLSVVSALSSFVTKLPSFLVALAMCIIATIFITVDYNRIARFIKRQLPQHTGELVSDVKNHFFATIFKYGRSYFLILLITFIEIAIGLLIIGVDNAILIALLIAIFDIFPIVGAGTILIPWAVIDFIIGKTSLGISLLILYAVEVSIRQIIEPKIVGQQVGLHPVATLMSMYVGTKLFGGLGLFGLPITLAIIKNLNLSGTVHFLKYDEPTEPDEHDDGGKRKEKNPKKEKNDKSSSPPDDSKDKGDNHTGDNEMSGSPEAESEEKKDK